MRRLGLLACLILLVSPVSAKEWIIDYGDSRLGFAGTQGTTPFDGNFKKFEAHVDLDPDHLESGKITASIDTSSATAGSSERDSNLPQSDWFDVKQFPQAQFASTSIHKTGDHAYVAEGNLTIKGVTKAVTLPFTLVQEGDHFRAQGKVPLIRTDFRVGEHDWSGEDYVKHSVDVTVDFSAKPHP